MSYLKTINRFSGKANLGGIILILVARASDIESIPEPVGGVIYGDIIFKAGKGWTTWRVTLESASSDSDTKQSREGASKNNRLPFSVPKYSAELHTMFEMANEDEFIVLHTDTNGKKKIFGLLETPALFSYSHNTGSLHTNKNEFSCQFYYEGPENMFEYQGAIPAAPEGPAPVIVRFNGAVIATLQPGDTLNIESDYAFSDYFITT